MAYQSASLDAIAVLEPAWSTDGTRKAWSAFRVGIMKVMLLRVRRTDSESGLRNTCGHQLRFYWRSRMTKNSEASDLFICNAYVNGR
ncbi:MAG: hypothetical protein ACE1ZG_07815 [Gammaproteobacteria bacterium]